MNSIKRVHELGQSLWLDYIRRDLIISGELEQRIKAGEIRGVTSNPTIFENAIAGSDFYTASLRPLAQTGWKAEQIFDALSIEDVRAAAEIFLPLYEETNGRDGFVSLEVNPKLANNSARTISEARRLWKTVNRPNAMVKIPATSEGIPAIQQAIAEGINVNVTLVFSLDRYTEVIEAYLRGLEFRLNNGSSLDHVASVASFFVSRVDTAIDTLLETIMRDESLNAERAAALLGKAAIANAKLAYAQFKAAFSGPRFEKLVRHGARVQRPLWASTSTKNPDYPDTYYVDNLIGPDTVNTLPPQTLEAFKDHGTAELTLEQNLSASRAQLEALEAINISMGAVTQQLEDEGVAKFAQSYTSLLKTLRKRARELRKELGALNSALHPTLDQLEQGEVGRRLWEGDTSLWTEQRAAAQEVRERLGWLFLPQESHELLEDLAAFTSEIADAGLTKTVLLGMGGSSLAADVMRRIFGSKRGMEFYILDSTDPASVRYVTRRAPIDKTLFIVASKSGTTTEPLALMEYFWARAGKRRGQMAGDHFVVVVDPGTPLVELARERGFRRVFSSPKNVGGRYSALSIFGLLPAMIMGIDASALLQGGKRMAKACGPNVEPIRNPGLFLGALLGAAARQGRDKLTLVADPGLEPLADWIEQLIAESSGKQGKGLLPVVGEPPGPARVYGDDRLLVYLRQEGALDRRVRGWIRSKLPVVVLETSGDAIGLGEAFFQWEVATAVACHLIGVNAFDQPDVQRAKDRTAHLLDVYKKRGSLPPQTTLWQGQGVTILGEVSTADSYKNMSLEEVLATLVGKVRDHEALIFLTYLRQYGAVIKRMARVRRGIRDKFKKATAHGFGPRYLHSTGQIHKGGPNRAAYIIVTAEPDKDVMVPEFGLNFGILERAQAIGDLEALQTLGRQVYSIHLDSPARFRDLATALLASIDHI
jgi:transaldolase/glucose-6-phosphate isomerase